MLSKKVLFKDVLLEKFDFISFAFGKLEPRLENGLAIPDFYRLCGCLFSLPKQQSKYLLTIFKRQYGVEERYRSGRFEYFFNPSQGIETHRGAGHGN